MRKFLLLLVLFIYSTNLNAQDKSFRNKRYQWPEEKLKPIPVNPDFANEDAVILSEKTEIELIHNNLYDRYNYDYLLNKTLRIKFLTANGIEKFRRFSLPESNDPFSDNYKKPTDSTSHGHQPKGDFDFMNYFSARLVHADGTTSDLTITDSSEIESFFLNIYAKGQVYFANTSTSWPDKKAFAVHFNIMDIKPGDEVEIAYSVKHVFLANRIFFHGALPKQLCEVKLIYNSNLDLFFVTQFNNAMYIDSTNNYKKASYRWVYNNLPACIFEKGARPYKDLPHIAYYRHFKDYGEINPSTNEITVYKPYNWQVVLANGATFEDIDKERAMNEMLDKSTVSFNKFFSQQTNGIPDSLTLKKVLSVHDTLVEVFDYQDDDAYYKGLDLKKSRFSEFTDQHKLREISRYEIYERMFRKLYLKYATTVLLDKRLEAMDFNKFALPISLHHVFCVPTGKQTLFLNPKQHRFGWYANEFPFYLEDILLLQIPQRAESDANANIDWRTVDFKVSRTPYSSVNDNTRSTNVKVELNASSPVKFDARVSLKGQFSTLTRGFYLYNYVDYSVNDKYYHKIWNICDDVKPTWNVSSKSNNFPYDFNFTASYQSAKILTLENGCSKLSMKSWFPFITEMEATTSKRVLPYYFDFAGNDTYRYFIKCDKPVQIINAKDYERNVDTEYFTYLCKITQPQPDVIMIESMLVTKKEMIPPHLVNGYLEVCKSADALNKGSLEIKF
jgi:hypothetical protein